MTPLLALTRANIRSYTRDRAALFWTLAFPLIFIFMLDLGTTKGNGTLVPDRQARWSGAPAHHPWDARTRCQKAPPAGRR